MGDDATGDGYPAVGSVLLIILLLLSGQLGQALSSPHPRRSPQWERNSTGVFPLRGVGRSPRVSLSRGRAPCRSRPRKVARMRSSGSDDSSPSLTAMARSRSPWQGSRPMVELGVDLQCSDGMLWCGGRPPLFPILPALPPFPRPPPYSCRIRISRLGSSRQLDPVGYAMPRHASPRNTSITGVQEGLGPVMEEVLGGGRAPVRTRSRSSARPSAMV